METERYHNINSKLKVKIKSNIQPNTFRFVISDVELYLNKHSLHVLIGYINCLRILILAITCDALTAPANGIVDAGCTSSQNFGATCTFTCNAGFTLVGVATLVCQGTTASTTGSYSAAAPTCTGKLNISGLNVFVFVRHEH